MNKIKTAEKATQAICYTWEFDEIRYVSFTLKLKIIVSFKWLQQVYDKTVTRGVLIVQITLYFVSSQQTRHIDPQSWADVVDGGPTLVQHWLDVSCLLGLITANYKRMT